MPRNKALERKLSKEMLLDTVGVPDRAAFEHMTLEETFGVLVRAADISIPSLKKLTGFFAPSARNIANTAQSLNEER